MRRSRFRADSRRQMVLFAACHVLVGCGRVRTSLGSDRLPTCKRVSAGDRALEKLADVYAVSLDQSTEVVHKFAGSLAEEELGSAERFRFDKDRTRFIVARGWLRELLGSTLGVPPSTIKFQYGPCGKPALALSGGTGRLEFNIAYSHGLAVVALCREVEVGVDVEAIRPVEDESGLVRTCFSPREQGEYWAVQPLERNLAFFNGWTRKEAFIKAIGKGLSQPLESFDISLAPGRRAELLRFGALEGAACGWSLSSFTPAPGYVAAVALRVQRELRIVPELT